jgi:16S rRNA (guanine1207-N2)-methyltransferase
MAGRRKKDIPLSRREVPAFVVGKLTPPALIVMGSPAEVMNVVAACREGTPTCYQMDHFQAERLRAELAEAGLRAEVVVRPDLWDVPGPFASALLLAARGGERELKIDLIEQSWHALGDKGTLTVWTPFEDDDFFPGQLKKVFGKIHRAPQDSPEGHNILWCVREGQRPRRRHEVTFQVKVGDGPSCRFLSRPGTFSYGRFDDGARALCEVMEIEPGDRVLDLGCGVGTNGVFAAQRGAGHVAFVDSNARAIELTKLNAEANGVKDFATFATATVEGPAEDSFDVAVANPPYFANSAVARLFIQRAKKLLTPQGRFFIVTKTPEEVGDELLAVFGDAVGFENRGYTILKA